MSFETTNFMYETIRALPIQFVDGIPDSFCWGASKDGTFNLQSTYCLARKEPWIDDGGTLWEKLWKAKVTLRAKFFMWKCLNNGIMVKQNLLKRGLAINPCCDQCPEIEESLLHVLRDCPKAKLIWDDLRANVVSLDFFSISGNEWLKTNCCNSDKTPGAGTPWNSVFMTTAWEIWKNKNKMTSTNGKHTMNSTGILNLAFEQVDNLTTDNPAPE